MGKSAIAEPTGGISGKLELTVSPDKLEAYLIFKTTGSQGATSAEIADFLQQKHIPLDRESTVRIRQAIEELQHGRLPRGGVLVKRGQTGGDSSDESVNWSVQADEGTENSLLPIFRATNGREVARIVPASVGESGLDVFGEPIPAPTPKVLNLSAGDGTAAGDEAGQIMATRDGAGLVVGNKICVVPLVEVQAAEFPADGIETPGIVIVTGDLGSGARIKAASGVWIKGNCAAAGITSGGPVICTEGFDAPAGGPMAKVRAFGGLVTPRIIRCNLEAQSDVKIEKLIQKSELQILGQLFAEKSQLIGSTVLVSGSAHLGDVGNFSADSQLSVTVGHHFRLKHQLQRLQRLLQKIKSAVAMVEQQSAGGKDAIGRHRLVKQELSRIQSVVQGHISDIGRQMLEYIDSEIHVSGTIFANATVSVAGVRGTVSSQFSGPASIAPRSVNGNSLLVIQGESGRKMVVRSS